MDLPAQANVTKYLKMLITEHLKMLITEQLKMLITEQLKMLMTVDLPAQTTLSTSAPSSAAVKASQAPNPQLHTSTQKISTLNPRLQLSTPKPNPPKLEIRNHHPAP